MIIIIISHTFGAWTTRAYVCNHLFILQDDFTLFSSPPLLLRFLFGVPKGTLRASGDTRTYSPIGRQKLTPEVVDITLGVGPDAQLT